MSVIDFGLAAPQARARLDARKGRTAATGPDWTLFVAVGVAFPVVAGIVTLGLLAQTVDGMMAALRPPPTPVKKT